MGRIVVRNLCKTYRLYARPRDRLAEWFRPGRGPRHHEARVLRDIGFELEAGTALGIIGMNGAGKSTLLRILGGTTLPTSGSFEVEGKVAGLLELGLGIHPEFNGWENARLSAQLLGHDADQIESLLSWVQEFSELGDHMDRPLRTYSTGMQVRLAFSAATAVRPDVLLIDEALSVGDVHFQHKSMARIRAMQRAGTTLLFVTHDPSAVKALCTRALLLDEGRAVALGPPDEVYDLYNAMIAERERGGAIEQRAGDDGRVATRSGSREVEVVEVAAFNAGMAAASVFMLGERAIFRCRVRARRAMALPTVGFTIRDRFGTDVFGTNSLHLGLEPFLLEAGKSVDVLFELPLEIGPGSYSVSVAVHEEADHRAGNFDWWDRALIFQVAHEGPLRFVGLARLAAEVRVVRDARDG